ncbi:KAP family NTPase [Bartonella sp. HY406]|nr:KAP family NTPase [Bartonella sp. HY406]
MKDYLNNENFAQFAVLLTGKWGSGKTHFILNLKKQYDALSPHEKLKENKEFNWIYVSLNGIDTIEEIEKRIFTAAHTWLNNTAVKLGKSFLGSIVASLQIYGVEIKTKKIAQELKELLPKVKNAAFIFDDIERCRLPLSNLFGYINNFIEHDRLKVVLVADEDKLKEPFGNDLSNNKQDPGFSTYEQVKEKLIGQTLEIKPDIKCALDIFIEKLDSKAVKELISANKNTITDIFKQSHTNNLRSLKAAFFTFERLHSFLSNIEIENKQENEIYSAQLSDLLLKIIVITLEYRAGIILQPSGIVIQMRSTTEDILSDFLKTDFDRKLLVEEFTAKGKAQKHPNDYDILEKRYSNIQWHQTAIEYSKIGLFIERGILPPEKSLFQSFKQDYLLRKPKQNDENISILWIRLFRWQFNDPNKLEKNLQPVMEALRNFKFTRMGDILQVASHINLLIEMNYNPLPNGESLEEYFTKYLTSLNAQNIPASFDELNDLRFDGYSGYGYYLEGAQSLVAKIKANTTKRAIKTLRNSRRLIDFISKDDFKNMSEEQYISFPLMNYVDVKDFARLINIAGEIHDTPPLAIRALINRYQNEANLKQEEQSWLKQLEDECQKQVAMLSEPFKTHRKLLLDGYFKNLILR